MIGMALFLLSNRRMKYRGRIICIPFLFLVACGESDSAPSNTDSATILLVTELTSSVLLGTDIIDCTLDSGSTTKCHELVFSMAIPFEDGPYCPETMDDIGGLGIYDGDTNPGFQVMKRDLWEAMETDGYDIVDDAGNVRIIDGAGGCPAKTGGHSALRSRSIRRSRRPIRFRWFQS